MSEYRIERDSLGEIRLPKKAYYGPQTQRAVENFRISGRTLPKQLVDALGLVKFAAAFVNRDFGKLGDCPNPPAVDGSAPFSPLNTKQVESILTACREVADGHFDDQFPVDIYQTGSGPPDK